MKAILWTLLAGMLIIQPALGQGKFSLSVSVIPYFRYANSKSTQLLPNLTTGGATPVDVAYRQNGQGYSIGVMGRYAGTSHWSISTGVLWNYTPYKAPIITTTPDLTTLNSVQFLSGSSHNHYYQIPILVNYQFSAKRLSPYFSAGVALNFSGISFIDNGNGTEIPVKFGKAITGNPILGIGGIYQLSTHLSVSTQPTFSYILPSGKTRIIYNKNYLLGLQAHVLYRF